MAVRELKQGEFLYQRGDPAPHFFFLLKGKIELVVIESGQDDFKFSKGVDEFEFFGIKQGGGERLDYARAVAETCWVLVIHKEQYELIVKKTQLSVSEQKIDFLMRYVPKLRAVTRNMVEELEVFFIKEVVTEGYMMQK